jgi:hypothetical protein
VVDDDPIESKREDLVWMLEEISKTKKRVADIGVKQSAESYGYKGSGSNAGIREWAIHTLKKLGGPKK